MTKIFWVVGRTNWECWWGITICRNLKFWHLIKLHELQICSLVFNWTKRGGGRHGRTTWNPFGGAPNFCPKSLSQRWHLQKKKKKGHRLFRCTFSITFGLNVPSSVCPNRCWPFFFLEMLLQWQIFRQKCKDTYSDCPKNLKLLEIFTTRRGQCPPGPPTSYAYGGRVLYRVLHKISIRLMRVSNPKQRCPVLLFCVILTAIGWHYTQMLSLNVDSSAIQLRHVKCLCDIGQNRCPRMRSMQQWIDGMIWNYPKGHIWILCRKHCEWTSLQ